VRLPDATLLVADAGHDRLVVASADGAEVLRSLGEGELREPNGLCLLPEDLAAAVGYDVVVADTVNHALRGVHLATGTVRTLAGTGRQLVPGDDDGALSSPWDVAWWQDRVWVAMAGVHQLWTFDPRTGAVEVAAGTANEGLLDGPLAEAWFAQTSGLAVAGDRLWIADSETSSLRYVEAGAVHTAVGTGLFDFGFQDGEAGTALLQHPLGVCTVEGGALVADTDNGALRRYDTASGELVTVASGLAEPSGLLPTDDPGTVLVVESAAHRLTPVALQEQRIDGPVSRTHRPPTDVAAGAVVLRVPFTPPPGQKVDERFGPATQLQVSATPAALLREGAGTDTGLTRTLVLDPAVGDGVLHVSARAASCDVAGGEGAACRMHQQDWGVPIRVSADGPAVLTLPLAGSPG
jgi:hypothetical protein